MNDRLIQIIALFVVVAGISGAWMISPDINTQRRDRQLTYDTVVGDNSNPLYVAMASAGSLRGIMVNMLWMRSEKLKQEDRHFEAMKLSELITTLQPRFPAVWEYMAWNMAYNISVKCATQEERWDWVNKGMILLRDQGIPNNPHATKLYRQLSWILFHKMGGQTDDMHWYYKREFAEEWEILLSAPSRDKTPIAAFVREPREKWHELLPNQFRYTAILQFRMVDEKAQAYFRVENENTDEFGEQNYTGILSAQARAQFFEDYPDLEPVIKELEALRGANGESLGLGLTDKTLRAFGRILMYEYNGYPLNSEMIRNREVLGVDGLALLEWMERRNANPDSLPVLLNGGGFLLGKYSVNLMNAEGEVLALTFRPALDLLRAQALIADYHMDPGFMMKLMDDFGPIDWRNVNAHALYWAALGSRKADEILDRTNVDLINLDRQRLHSLQGLAHFGTLAFRPRVDQLGEYGEGMILTMPEPRLIEAYGIALEQTRARLEEWDTPDDTYLTGRENFLHSAIVNSFYGGQTGQAREYYVTVKEEFNTEESRSIYKEDYARLSLEEFAYNRLIEDELKDNKRAYLVGLLMRAWGQGLLQNDLTISQNLYHAARAYYEKLEEEAMGSSNTPGVDTQGRMNLPPFDDLVVQTLGMTLVDPSFRLRDRSDMWRLSSQFLSPESRIRTYYGLRVPLRIQFEAQGYSFSVEQAFPKPPGFDEWSAAYDEQLREDGE